jgi:hypothetical protein
MADALQSISYANARTVLERAATMVESGAPARP